MKECQEMKGWIVLRSIVIACCLVSLATAQETKQAVEPKLIAVFNDDFSTDTRGDYEINGDVAWEPGTLTLSEGSSIKRAINGGPWAKIELDFGKDGWGSGSESQELRIWFLLDGATNCFVQFRKSLNGKDGPTGSVALVDTGERNGQLIAEVVREMSLPKGALRSLSIEYRYGLVTVTTNQSLLMSANLENGLASVIGSSVQIVDGSTQVQRWTTASVPPAPALTADQQRQATEATTADRELMKLYQKGRFAEAAEVGERVLKLRKQAYGEEHCNYAASLGNVASMYHVNGDYSRAETLHMRACRITRKVLGGKHPEYATSLNNLAVLYLETGKYSQAEPLHQQARAIRKEVLGEYHPDYARSLNNLGRLYVAIGEYARARPLYLQASDIWKKRLGEKHPDYATSLDNLGGLHYSLGQYALAERFYIHAHDIRKKVFGEEHPHYAVSVNNLGVLYKAMGERAKAEQMYLRAVDIRKKVGEEHPDYALSLNNLARLYDWMGEYARAEPLYIRARDIRKKVLSEEHPDYARTISHLASMYNLMGEYAKAEQLYLKTRDIQKKVLGEEHPDYATNLSRLAALYESMGEYVRAEPLYLQARAIQKKILGDQNPEYATLLNNLAGLSRAQGDYSTAEPLLLESRRLLSAAAARAVPSLSEAQAHSWMRENRPRADIELAVLRRQQKWDSPKAYAAVWRTKGMVLRLRVGQSISSTSPPAAREAFAKLRDARLKLGKLVSATPPPSLAKGYRQALAEASARKETLEKSLATLNAATARELSVRDAKVDDLLEQVPDGVAIVDFVKLPDWEHEAKELSFRRGNGTTETRTVKKEKARPVYDAFVLRADRSKTGNPAKWIPLGSAEPIESAIASWRTKFALADDGEAGSKATLADPEQMLRKLIWDKLEPHLDGIHTVVLIPDGALHRLPWAALPGRNEGEYLIHDYALSTASSGQQLYGALTDTEIEQSPQLLVVGGIEYDKRPTQPSVNGGPTLIASAGRPIMRSKDDFGWGYLEGTEKEATNIARLWGDRGTVSELRGVQADEHSLARLLPQSRFAHLATHGFFDTRGEIYGTNLREQSLFETSTINAQRQSSVAYRNPLLMTGIVMAGANVPPEKDDYGLPVGDDGILTAEEISGLDLRNTELVTLSACETGLGDVAAGEGVYGLTRVLHKSGVRSVVASQWKVSDVATQELMRRFYENLWVKKQSKIEALRSAQLWMLEHPKELQAMGIDDVTKRAKPRDLKQQTERPQTSVSNRTAPFFWAAFQLSGDWR
ncbi:MAG: CHAT domain-containing tetratricopeptide repeat protein [Planctomycetota bacterium]